MFSPLMRYKPRGTISTPSSTEKRRSTALDRMMLVWTSVPLSMPWERHERTGVSWCVESTKVKKGGRDGRRSSGRRAGAPGLGLQAARKQSQTPVSRASAAQNVRTVEVLVDAAHVVREDVGGKLLDAVRASKQAPGRKPQTSGFYWNPRLAQNN